MSLKRYLKIDGGGDYSWLALVSNHGRFEVTGERKGSRVLLFRGLSEDNATEQFDYLANKHGAYSLSQPLTNYLVRT